MHRQIHKDNVANDTSTHGVVFFLQRLSLFNQQHEIMALALQKKHTIATTHETHMITIECQ